MTPPPPGSPYPRADRHLQLNRDDNANRAESYGRATLEAGGRTGSATITFRFGLKHPRTSRGASWAACRRNVALRHRHVVRGQLAAVLIVGFGLQPAALRERDMHAPVGLGVDKPGLYRSLQCSRVVRASDRPRLPLARDSVMIPFRIEVCFCLPGGASQTHLRGRGPSGREKPAASVPSRPSRSAAATPWAGARTAGGCQAVPPK